MRLTGVALENWLCHPRRSIKFTPLSLICGPNAAGKTAVKDAIRFGIEGALSRVDAKGDRDKLITEGAEKGSVTLQFGDVAVVRDIKSAKFTKPGKIPTESVLYDALPLVLEPSSFAGMDPDSRRNALIRVTGITIDTLTISEQLRARGRRTDLLGAKFRQTDPIEKWWEEAKAAVTEARGVWKGITGETYGSVKAETWRAAEVAVPTEEEVAQCRADIRQCDIDIDMMQRMLGRIEQAEQTSPSMQREQLGQKARQLPGAKGYLAELEDELEVDNEALARADDTLADVKARQPGADPLHCPHCGAAVKRQDGVLEPWSPPENPSTPAELAEAITSRTSAYETVQDMKRRIARAEGQVADAQSAANLLESLESEAAAPITEETPAADILPRRSDTERQIEQRRVDKKGLEALLATYNGQIADSAAASATTQKAEVAHKKIVQWSEIAADLAPTGIQQELLANALGPLNAQLRDLAARFKWPQPRVAADLSITLDGRDYRLRSESEQWRGDALLAIAFAILTKLRIVILDRFDVLEFAARGAFIQAAYNLTTGPKAPLGTCILIGTLKAPPPKVPGVEMTWIDRPAAMEQAA